MKTKYWIAVLAAIFLICAGISLSILLPGEDAAFAEITSNGHSVTTVDLQMDQVFSVTTPDGTNTITVKDGKIGVTQASCPDHYCMDRGMCSQGAEIVCLPNRLVIRFVGKQSVDSVVG